MRVRLYTGRSHQIRVQFSSRKHPLVGDHKYGARDGQSAPMLYSCCITFPWQGKRLRFERLPDWAMLPEEDIRRIATMEEVFDRACLHPDPADIRLLSAYVDSGDWLRDYDADRAGRIPRDMKRGILSQDALYDLLTESADMP